MSELIPFDPTSPEPDIIPPVAGKALTSGQVALKTCTLHQPILDRCLERLKHGHYFEKREVLRSLGFSPHVDDGVDWAGIRAILEDGYKGHPGVYLAPIAQTGVNDIRRAGFKGRLRVTPTRAMASGNSKKTAGYVDEFFDGGRVVQAHDALQRRKRDGTSGAISKRRTSGAVNILRSGQEDMLPVGRVLGTPDVDKGINVRRVSPDLFDNPFAVLKAPV